MVALTSGVQRHTIELRGGRRLEAAVVGPPDGPALVFHHGTPGSAFVPPKLEAAVIERGWRLVAPSRSGYGDSSRDDGRDVAAVVPDTRELLDALGIDRFVTAGWSGGGPHALACAALLADRCAAVLSVAGVAPYLPDEFDWLEGMGEENIKEFGLSLEGGPAYDEMLATLRDELLEIDATQLSSLRDLFGDLVSDADEAAGTPEMIGFLADNAHHGLAGGVGGWRDDDQSFLRDWGFAVETIRVPTCIWYGSDDHFVPPSHGAWLGAHVPGAIARRFEGDGHLSVAWNRMPELLEGLAGLAGAPW